ncbi:MAG: alpha/beta hydrolase [Acidimicrobiales bacterium]
MLDPQTKAVLDKLEANPMPRMWEMTPQETRAAFDAFFAENGLPPCDLVDRSDRAIPGPHGPIPIRVYRPRTTASGLRAGLVYFHGGGMVANSIDTYDALVQHLCERSGCVVVSVGYRLSPEHRFPIPVDDAYAAAAWTSQNAVSLGIDPVRLAVGGDSAGGYLTAVVTQLARDRGGPAFAFQLLIYPAVGTRGYSPSLAEFATGYLFERIELDWILTQYLADPNDCHDPRVAPILATDFSDLPPAFLLTAEYEIMRDDAEHYGQLLTAAGVPVELHRYDSTIHPFLNLAGVIDAGRDAIEECADKLRAALAAPPVLIAAENDFVRIVHVSLEEGEVFPDYEPAARSVVAIDLIDGSVTRHDEPIGPSVGPAREVRVELKAAADTEPSELDAIALDPDRYRVELDDERVRVVRLRFDAGEQGLMVSHPPRVLVTMTDVWVNVRFADGRTDERGAPAGLAVWLDAETLQTRNAGAGPLEVLLVEPKTEERTNA